MHARESGFDELQILGQEDLIVETLRRLLKSYAELNRREEITKDFLKSLCSFSLETHVWRILLEDGGAQRFTDLYRVIGCGRSPLSSALQELRVEGLVRMVGERYLAISPAWLVYFSGESKS